jgi:hypothetical protein
MAPGREGGVRKSNRGYYDQKVQKLQAVVEAKLQEVSALDAAREQMAEREQASIPARTIFSCGGLFNACHRDLWMGTGPGLLLLLNWVPHVPSCASYGHHISRLC